MKRLIGAALLLSMVAVVARADWNPGDGYKMHFPQLPDLSTTGVDVSLSSNELADDWLCTSSGPVNDVHIWTSFIGDRVPPNGPGSLPVTLSIYSDVPAGPNGGSHPGSLLWSEFFAPGAYKTRLYAQVPQGEWFYDPSTGFAAPAADTLVFQDNFDIPTATAMVQTKGTMYWLSVRSDLMGWKSSLNHFADDAVFKTPGTTWNEMFYPSQHPMHGQSMDLSFVITPEPSSFAMMGTGLIALVGGVLRRRRR